MIKPYFRNDFLNSYRWVPNQGLGSLYYNSLQLDNNSYMVNTCSVYLNKTRDQEDYKLYFSEEAQKDVY